MAFRVAAAAQCKNICPERLNWPGRLAGWQKIQFDFNDFTQPFSDSV